MSTYSWECVRRLVRLDLLGDLSVAERKALKDWVDESEEHRLFYRRVRAGFQVNDIRSCLQTDAEGAWEKVRGRTFGGVSVPSAFRKWWRYAAVVVPFVLAVSLWQVRERGHRPVLPEPVRASESLFPVLTLDNGEKYCLDAEERTEIEVDGGARAYKTGEGLVYDAVSKTDSVTYNRIYVPRGSEYRLVLADGTRVWLNADSELRYPVAFLSDDRKVFLRGEAYFEVAADKNRPFYVEAGEVEVRVLGTSFDVNTHCLKGVRTVLVKGSVALKCAERPEIRMNPGELVDFDRAAPEVVPRQVDVGPYISWKDGFFVFEDETLEEIMNTLALWYDKEIFFVGGKNRNYHFSGHLKRYDSIETILSAITEVVGVEFLINEKMILIR